MSVKVNRNFNTSQFGQFLNLKSQKHKIETSGSQFATDPNPMGFLCNLAFHSLR